VPVPPTRLVAPPGSGLSAREPAIMNAPRGKTSAVTLSAAEIGFAADGKTLSPEDQQHLVEVAKLQKSGGAALRVIGYARRGFGADPGQELQSFGDALDRANVVSQALARLGVPAARITVQASPEVAGGLSAGEAEVLLEY
jgi:outer membrane protein OmpA-like peptidoglycan-associated protein